MGMVARRDIKRGEVILKEKPLFVVPTEVSHMFPGALIMNSLALLKPIQREAFWNLSYVNLPGHLVEGTPEHSEGLALAIFQTNAVAAGGAVGIFPQMARLNHGCSSAFNSVYSWRQNEGVIVVHALKSVRQGQELLTTYADTKRPRDERRSFLQAHYGFTCQCSVCSLDAGRSQLSDARLVKMAQLYSRFKSWGDGTLSGREAIDIAGEIWRVGEEEGYHSERGQLAADATYIAASHSDASAVRVWARLAREWYTYELGADSEQAEGMAVLFEHPERHSGWATRRAEIVGGLT
ncbi:hypothetical protein BC835DRAFT_688817 [Cytidiella melzeri]|nr:hypothetical protein BC835DRAFT_688817 [Cytidiella melzeri]